MSTPSLDAARGGSRFPGLLAAVLGFGFAGAAAAAQPIPLQAGTYCGPGDARIVVDVARDRVEIDHLVCSFPIIAADHLQSELCSNPAGTSDKRIFDFRVVGREFIHDGAWYRLCGPVPANPADPDAAAPPAKSGG
jgi:hypothetical protein